MLDLNDILINAVNQHKAEPSRLVRQSIADAYRECNCLNDAELLNCAADELEEMSNG